MALARGKEDPWLPPLKLRQRRWCAARKKKPPTTFQQFYNAKRADQLKAQN